MKYLPPNSARGCIGLIAFLFAAFGAGILWGAEAGFFTCGFLAWINLTLDEALERITNTARGDEPEDAER